jgi:hypothetical protein
LRKKTKRWWWAGEAWCHLLHLRKKKQRNDDELGRLTVICYIWKKIQKMTTSWEAPNLMSSPGFFFNYELSDCITTWCLSWVFMILLRSHWLHHLMHLLCDVADCITPLDAPHRILWSH